MSFRLDPAFPVEAEAIATALAAGRVGIDDFGDALEAFEARRDLRRRG